MRGFDIGFVVLLVGCSAPSMGEDEESDVDLASDLQEDTSARSAWDGTPKGIGALDFLNDGQTSEELLDDAVALDKRAAANLISHRDGGDDIHGTSDDDPFGSIYEVDEVAWVGPSAIGKILEYADDLGWVPTGNDELGIWDKVTFTVNEAAITVDIANTAPDDELEMDIKLDWRAATSIVEARPITSVDEMAGLYYVGKSALTNLKTYAIALQDDYEDWFDYDEEVIIPDADPDGIDTVVHVDGVPDGMPLHLEMSVDVDHKNTAELELDLVSPSGTRVVVSGCDFGSAFEQELSVFENEDPEGDWTLTIRDDTPGVEGVLLGWEIAVCDGWDDGCE